MTESTDVISFAIGIHMWFIAFLLFKIEPPKKEGTRPIHLLMMILVLVGAGFVRASI